jgi:hypothetical protein
MKNIKMEIESKINDENNLVPDTTILIITDSDEINNQVFDIVEPLKGKIKRDWFVTHAYHCLPLTIGNQYGFAIKSLYDFTAIWNGGDSQSDVIVNVKSANGVQFINSHFGMGTITIQNQFHFRTPLGINLMTINPPNMFIPNLHNMTGVIETDNLRRDFTFNLKITVPNVEIKVNAGEIISAFIPIPRFFVDSFEIKLATGTIPDSVIKTERQAGIDFGIERTTVDTKKHRGNGQRYKKGVDIYDNEFYKHQPNL